MVYALVLVSLLAGTLVQRLTGMGFALLAAPVLVLLLGPRSGVVMVTLCGTAVSLALLLQQRRAVRWSAAVPLTVGAVAGVLPGSWLQSRLPTGPLLVVVGALTLAGLGAVVLGARRAAGGTSGATPPGPAVLAGTAAGTIQVLAGIGGVPLSIFAVRTRWSPASFAASVQAVFVVMGAAALLALTLRPGPVWPVLTTAQWAGAAAALALGFWAGPHLTRRVSAGAARTTMLVVAVSGGAATLLKGISLL